MTRPSWDDYFIQLTNTIASRSTCDRGRSGCVIVNDKRILCTGYAGSPPGLPHCDEVGHLMKKMIDDNDKITQHCTRTTHAEQNALNQAARFGIVLDGSTLYCKMEPCASCAKSIIGSGIKKVICEKKYHAADETRDMFSKSGIELVVLNDQFEKYENI